MNEIEIYKTPDKTVEVRVQFKNETVWLSQKMMAELFDKDSDTISLHLKNIYSEGELGEDSTTEFFSVVQMEGKRQVKRNTKFYNLDAILSVGYRVNSKRGTQFRQWATQRLKDYLVKGYAVNKKRLEELNKVIEIIQNSNYRETKELSEAKGLLDILSKYTKSFILLNQYDSNNIELSELDSNITYEIVYEDAIAAIHGLKQQLINKKGASSLFGNQKDESFRGILKSVTQTFDGYYLYPAIEEQASHLLYFIIKNHPFTDGNKRIGAFIFI